MNVPSAALTCGFFKLQCRLIILIIITVKPRHRFEPLGCLKGGWASWRLFSVTACGEIFPPFFSSHQIDEKEEFKTMGLIVHRFIL